ncbi:MAG TPA: trehalase family glycosidase, partial [Terriglobales bacterium]|nr:trehalase family glycosidase [Terriglobales bacterium]
MIHHKHRKPTARIGVALLVLGLSLPAGALQAQSAPQQPSSIQDILDYIEGAWAALTRSMQDCKTTTEEKFATETVLYVPADVQVPPEAASLEQRCHIRVQPLPEPIHKLGSTDLSKIKQAGLLYLPNPYVVPGGFFNEMYGWDSYFIIRGLIEAGKLELARGMVENFFYEIEHYGAVLNANRTYYLTRSQPPFLSSMVMAVYDARKAAGNDDRAWLARAYSFIAEDHAMWTSGEKLAGDTGLSRYYDFGQGPVPESFGQEENYYDTVARWVMAHPGEAATYLATGAEAEKLPNSWPKYSVRLCGGMNDVRTFQLGESARPPENPSNAGNCSEATRVSFTPDFYRGDRAMRESGYDISFRFGPFGGSTHHYAPVDLNTLIYKEEKDLQQIAAILGKNDDARHWSQRAEARRQAINRYMWDESKGMYFDYDFMRQRQSGYVFVTTFCPLWAGIPSPQQARRMMQNLNVFEESGGLVESRNDVKVQWEWPWGWAPSQLISIEGMRRYDFEVEANRVAAKFLDTVLRNFRKEKTIREKYNVVTGSSQAEIQAGYRQNVVGFGW